MGIDVTVGGASANSYASVAEADAYMDTLSFRTAWPTTGTSSTPKEAALQHAARILDTYSWVGTKATSTQALAWPRYGVTDRDGWPITVDTIPRDIKNAQCELALRLMAGDRAAQDSVQPMRAKVGAIEVEYAQGVQPRVTPSFVLQLAGQYLKGGGTVRVERA